MSGRESAAVERAVADVSSTPLSLSEIARRHEVAVSTLRRALRRRGVAPREHPSGDAHHERRQAARAQAPEAQVAESCAAE